MVPRIPLLTFGALFFCVGDGLLLNDPAVLEQRFTHMESLIQGLTQEVNTLKQENADLKAKISLDECYM
jgi:hypothetical protein